MGLFAPLDLKIPASRAEIAAIQSARKPVAIENARRAPYYQGKLDHLDLTRLDDPGEWAKAPIIDKEELRRIGIDAFNGNFLICDPGEVAEFWRSGGATGVPLFYPRTREDIEATFRQLCRCWDIVGGQEDDVVHMSFPLGVHPAGHLWARSAYHFGIGVLWAGSGANTPSQTQLELIEIQQPTMWMGMPSYGLHLANMAAAQGIDLANSRVRKVLVGAEALSDAKRGKLERMWGAEVHDLFGMTEVGIPGGDSIHHEGFHIWTDQFLFEVVDEDTGLPVAEGEPGLMLITPLFTNNATPFLRWSSGDIVTISYDHSLDGPYGVFPVMRHAHRTAGFWKVRGVNINHAEMEDLVFRLPAVNDFRVEARTGDALEYVWLGIEVPADADGAQVSEGLAAQIKQVFEVTAEVDVLETGTLAAEFETTVKAARFVDRRE